MKTWFFCKIGKPLREAKGEDANYQELPIPDTVSEWEG